MAFFGSGLHVGRGLVAHLGQRLARWRSPARRNCCRTSTSSLRFLSSSGLAARRPSPCARPRTSFRAVEPVMVMSCCLPVPRSLRGHLDDAVCVDGEGDLNLGHAAQSGTDAAQLELAQGLVERRPPRARPAARCISTLTLEVGGGGEDLAALDRDGGVAVDHASTTRRPWSPRRATAGSRPEAAGYPPHRRLQHAALDGRAHAPRTSSGFTDMFGSLPVRLLHRRPAPPGMRLEPPTEHAPRRQSPRRLRPASESACSTGPIVAVHQVGCVMRVELGARSGCSSICAGP